MLTIKKKQMPQNAQLKLIREMLEKAESHLKTARQILDEVLPGGAAKKTGTGKLKKKYEAEASELPQSGIPEEGEQIVEGIFDGQNMIGRNHQIYPVPANYASKSKLIAGDALKLIIGPDGSFTYKQIGPVERKRVTGTLVQEGGQYKVLTNGNSYKVLLASVTYFRGEIGDKITVLVPVGEETEWAAIENVLPQNGEHPEELTLGNL